jgi:hypothetical protein
MNSLRFVVCGRDQGLLLPEPYVSYGAINGNPNLSRCPKVIITESLKRHDGIRIPDDT